jgi:hypothetical protein
MRLQDHLIETTRNAMEEAFRYAKAVPEDRLNWQPLDAGRSVLDMARELAKCPDWACDVLDGKGMQEDPDEDSAAEMGAWASIEECEAVSKEKLARYFAFIAGYPDVKLAETIDLPYGPGGSMRTFTMAELMDYPRWNAAYHQGQIAYIQTLYGDTASH